MPNALDDARAAWRATDGWVLAANAAALAAHLGNTAWRSADVVYVATLVPLVVLAARSRRDATLRWALGFGVTAGFLWAFGEGVFARTFGWWGRYHAAGPRVWDTPVYCLLVGAQACSHVVYIALRSLDARLAPGFVAILTGLHALGLSAAGENLLVAAGMWSYVPWGWMWGAVPVWVVAGYSAAYVSIPWLRRLRAVPAAATFTALTFVTGVAAALLVRFQGIAAAAPP